MTEIQGWEVTQWLRTLTALLKDWAEYFMTTEWVMKRGDLLRDKLMMDINLRPEKEVTILQMIQHANG